MTELEQLKAENEALKKEIGNLKASHQNGHSPLLDHAESIKLNIELLRKVHNLENQLLIYAEALKKIANQIDFECKCQYSENCNCYRLACGVVEQITDAVFSSPISEQLIKRREAEKNVLDNVLKYGYACQCCVGHPMVGEHNDLCKAIKELKALDLLKDGVK